MSTPDRIRSSRRTLLKASAASAALALANGIAPPWAAARNDLVPPILPPTADPEFAALDAFVGERMAALGVPGVAVGVLVGDREHAAGFGVTNVDHPLPVDAATLFQIGSTTKTYTGTALMRLVEAGKLDLDAPVRAYLPGFRVADAAVSEAVTVRDLVTHTAGWFGDDFTDTGDGDDALARSVDGMADLPQVAPLGAFFSYNNAALNVAGRIVEVLSGKPYEAALKELVLAPLGMERSFFFAQDVITEAVAAGHNAPEGTPVVVGPWALPRAVNPAGGIVSDVRDVLRFARFHLGSRAGSATGSRAGSATGSGAGGARNGGDILSVESLERMRTPLGPGGALASDLLDGVGVTWLLSTVDGVRVVQHGGTTNGQQSALVLVPERGFAVAVLANADRGGVLGAEVVAWALERFLGVRAVPPTARPLPEALAAEIIGHYGDPATISVSVAVAEGDGAPVATPLQAGEPIPGEALSLRFVGGDRFVADYHGIPFYTDAVRDDAGEVAWLRFSGRLFPAQRGG